MKKISVVMLSIFLSSGIVNAANEMSVDLSQDEIKSIINNKSNENLKGFRRKNYTVGCSAKKPDGSPVACWTERAFFKEQALVNAVFKCVRETGIASTNSC